MRILKVASFHSVKGGVGKSTLALLAASELCGTDPSRRVILVDLDLTGTSLADVLPLQAPALPFSDAPTVDLRASEHSGAVLSVADTREGIETRETQLPPSAGNQAIAVPFLNDYFLFADSESEADVPLRNFQWRVEGGPATLAVLPSSALPVDLDRTVPLVYDEDHAAFIEARLEWMLDEIIASTPDTNEVAVVFDTPPSIPGLSRAVLSLAFRLSRDSKVALAQDGFIPANLEASTIDWRVFVVSTPDTQDLRATARWLGRISQEHKDIVTVLLNRFPVGDEGQLRRQLEERLVEHASPLLDSCRWVAEAPSFQVFRSKQLSIPDVPPGLAGWLGDLGDGHDADEIDS